MAKFGFDEKRLFNISDVSLEQVASAPTILSGQTAVYAKTDDLLYFYADGGSEQQITVGGINLGSDTPDPDGANVFVQQNSSTAKLEFRRLRSTDGTVNFDDTTDPNFVDITVDLSDINDELDHGQLLGLADDDHLQYLLLAGRAGGQIANGGTAASENLTLRSTANATKGAVQIDDGSNFIFNSKVHREVEVQTTNATITTLATIALADDTVYWIKAEVLCRRTDGGGQARAVHVIEGCFYRAAAGSATQQGNTSQQFKVESANVEVDFSVSGNNVLLQVTGIAAQTFDWKAQVEYIAQN